MKQAISFFLLLMTTTMVSASRTITVSVKNPLDITRADVPIIINLAPYGTVCSALVTQNGQEIPCQLDDLDKDDTFDELCFLVNLDKKEKKKYAVTFFDEGEPRSYPARVYTSNLSQPVAMRPIPIMSSTIMVLTLRANLTAFASTSMPVRHSTFTVSTRSSWNCRKHNSIPMPTRRPVAMATMCCGLARPSDLVPSEDGTVRNLHL